MTGSSAKKRSELKSTTIYITQDAQDELNKLARKHRSENEGPSTVQELGEEAIELLFEKYDIDVQVA